MKKFKVAVSLHVLVEAEDWEEAQKKGQAILDANKLHLSQYEDACVEHVTHCDNEWNEV